MRANLELTRGLIFAEAVQMALAPRIGRDTAHTLVGRACRRAAAEGAHLRDILLQEPQATAVLDRGAIERLFDPARYLGASGAYVERALARHPANPA
jgi:3-carboxy-cis,cis-muconate cycloisomerase